jgi:hypothetical protein
VRALDYKPLDILVVDSGSTDSTSKLAQDYPAVRFMRETRPGIEPMRRRALVECRGDILAFLNDDAVVDRRWISSIVRAFLADPDVMVVAGLIVPGELGPDAQRAIETCRVEGRGFRRRWDRANITETVLAGPRAPGDLGSMANVAFWRQALGGVSGACTVIYEPSAIARCARLPVDELEWQLTTAFPERMKRNAASYTWRGETSTRRRIDLAEPLRPIADASGFDRLTIDVFWEGASIGEVTIAHHGAVVSAAWLSDVVAQDLTAQALDAGTKLGGAVLWSTVTSTLAKAMMPAIETSRKERRRRLSEAA